ncbi:MAG: aminomethyltransferase family protein [Verrucomicrobiales bacterium]|nr:aminomethyltransferase family protein [Verrucomicrobiales bacterium]
MRASLLRPHLAQAGASFRPRHGVEVVAHFTDRASEYAAIRNAVGLTDFSFLRTFAIPEAQAIDALDVLLAGNVPKIRFGRVLHTFLADPHGHVVADCFVANNDQEFLFTCESILSDDSLNSLLDPSGSGILGQDLTPDIAVFSLDGYKAWEIVKKVFGPDVLGLPYLSIENYSFAGQPVRLIRAGKTSEFGYLLFAPKSAAAELFETLRTEVTAREGRLCGVEVHDDLRLDGRFFNIHAEGSQVRDPLPLGLQWMVDFDKPDFLGAAAIRERRAAGLQSKIIGLAAPQGAESIVLGTELFHEGRAAGKVVAQGFSPVLSQSLALGLLPIDIAYSGLEFRRSQPDGPALRSISMPPIMPRSLSVKLDEM